jgi:hypothetical protein
MTKIISCIEKQPLPILLFIVLCASFLNSNISGGEYQYLCYAKQFMDPSWIPGSFSVNEWAGSRILYQLIIGPFLKYAGFEATIVFFKIILFFGHSYYLSKIFIKTGLTKTESVFVITLFITGKQYFFGLEWIFGGIEPKLFAYLFIWAALWNLMNNNLKYTYIFALLATLFHLMVGGWFVVVTSLYFFIHNRFNKVLVNALYFFIPVIPFVVYLGFGIFASRADPEIYVHSPNWIYVYERLSHHLGIFGDREKFIKGQLPGIIYSILAMAFSIFLIKKANHKPISILSNLIIIIVAIQLIFVIMAAIDKYVLHESGKLLLKYYPFRMSSLAMMLFILSITLYVKHLTAPSKLYKGLLSAAFVFSFLLLISHLNMNISKQTKINKEYIAFFEMAQYIKNNTDQSSDFMLFGFHPFDFENSAFIKECEREIIVVPKFTPAVDDKLLEWHKRKTDVLRLSYDTSLLIPLAMKYDAEYVLSKTDIDHPSLDLVYKNTAYQLSKITLHNNNIPLGKQNNKL